AICLPFRCHFYHLNFTFCIQSAELSSGGGVSRTDGRPKFVNFINLSEDLRCCLGSSSSTSCCAVNEPRRICSPTVGSIFRCVFLRFWLFYSELATGSSWAGLGWP